VTSTQNTLCGTATQQILPAVSSLTTLNNIIIAPSSPTHFPTNARHRPDILDIALVRSPYPTPIENLNELASDHNSILLEMMCTLVSSSPPVTNHFINRKKFNTILTNLPNTTNRPTSDIQSIDLAIDCQTKQIQHAIKASIYTPKHKNLSWPLHDYIKLEINGKNRLCSEWQKNRDLTVKRQLNSKISYIRTLFVTYRND